MAPVLVAPERRRWRSALGISSSPMTAIGGLLVVATCTEFTSLILLRYIEERRRGLEPQAAMDVTAARTGRASRRHDRGGGCGGDLVLVAAVCCATSVSSSPQGVTHRPAGALIVLPPLIIWADKRGGCPKGMLDPPRRPYLGSPTTRPGSVRPPWSAGVAVPLGRSAAPAPRRRRRRGPIAPTAPTRVPDGAAAAAVPGPVARSGSATQPLAFPGG